MLLILPHMAFKVLFINCLLLLNIIAIRFCLLHCFLYLLILENFLSVRYDFLWFVMIFYHLRIKAVLLLPFQSAFLSILFIILFTRIFNGLLNTDEIIPVLRKALSLISLNRELIEGFCLFICCRLPWHVKDVPFHF